ncbi:hypothetical protein JST97_38545 [bacterium]|nr:hypothetical protein [bacterium]
MKTKTWLVGLSLLGLLCIPTSAEQLYIRNRPFKGAVKKSDGRLWVDLKTFAEALGATVEEGESGTTIKMPEAAEASKLETMQDNGVVMVPLEGTAKLVGARVVVNKQMGTIDVSMAAAVTRPAGNAPAAVAGPIIRNINKSGSDVEVTTMLVPGRTNIVEFGAEW